ncbi:MULTISPECIES: flavin reductase family protein [Virgibacillus]|uniref:NADH-dependent flavin reductase n=1 Tax=Virgibacillus massiliensis TaxID=1462526 RepID=A0A024QE61_9BACI|nr:MULTISPECIES: flavin reductase family protein [Virgibacillus]MYL42618.1 flavin reductase [Virgibacillus massiliensis]CDQ40502.1 NADH-dependent flavin reductase [Virgibacillus massiliensis]
MESRTFRNAMGRFATGVTVITTKSGEDHHGMTANAFMSVSLDPKLITVSIDNRANMLHKINQSGKFAVSFLSDKQQDISMHFAGQANSGEEIQFDYIQQIPVIQNALASVVCDLDRSVEVGDHTLFIGKVVDINLTDGNPLTFFGGKYGKHEPVEYV